MSRVPTSNQRYGAWAQGNKWVKVTDRLPRRRIGDKGEDDYNVNFLIIYNVVFRVFFSLCCRDSGFSPNQDREPT
jgi:hypothetical protein